MTSRRDFVSRFCFVVAATAIQPVAAVGDMIRANVFPRRDRVDPKDLDFETFSELVNTDAQVRLSSREVIRARLTEVRRRDVTKREGSAVDLEQFSLVFRCGEDLPSDEAVFQVEHDQVGVFDLALLPVDPRDRGSYYEAVFSRPKQAIRV